MRRTALILAAGLALAACAKASSPPPADYGLVRQCSSLWAIYLKPDGTLTFRSDFSGEERNIAPGVPLDDICG